MKNIQKILFFAVGVTLLFGCKKDENLTKNLKGGPGQFDYTFTDTLSVFTQTISEDSIATSGLNRTVLAGKMNDPLMGESSSRAYFQINLSELDNVVNVGTNHVDSAVILINLTSESSNYGNTNSFQYLELYELNEEMNDTTYFSNSSLNFNPNPIGYYNGIINTKDNVALKNKNLEMDEFGPSLKIKLSNTFTQKLFNASANDLKGQEEFVKYIKGVTLRPSAGVRAQNEGAIYAFNLKSAASRVRMYYNDSLFIDFPMGENVKRFSEYKSESKTNLLKQKLAGSYNADTCFAQALRICKTKVQLPTLLNLLDNGKIAVHKAVIEVNAINFSGNSKFPIPNDLLVFKADKNSLKNIGMIDQLGKNNHEINFAKQGNKYQFIITNEIQKLLLDKQNGQVDNNHGFYLNIPADLPIQPTRIMFDTRKNVPEGIKFLIWYTKL